MQFGTVEMSGSLSATSSEQEAVFKIFDVSWKVQGQVNKKLLAQTFILWACCLNLQRERNQ